MTNTLTSNPPAGVVLLQGPAGDTSITIPAKGARGKGLLTLVFIGLWLFTILVFTVFLFMINPVSALYSLPFWGIGFWTFFKALSVLRLKQSILLSHDTLTISMKQGNKSDEKTFPANEIKISLVEGPYYSYSGLSRRGQYPAVIYKDESFGFAERCSSGEKTWLLNFINDYYNTK